MKCLSAFVTGKNNMELTSSVCARAHVDEVPAGSGAEAKGEGGVGPAASQEGFQVAGGGGGPIHALFLACSVRHRFRVLCVKD